MNQIILDASVSSKLHDLGHPVELCEPSGRVLGRFVPLIDMTEWEPVSPDITEEELERRATSKEKATRQQKFFLTWKSARRNTGRIEVDGPMPPEQMLVALQKRPFQPFRLTLTDGRTLDVRHPEMLLPGRRFAVIGLLTPGESEPLADRAITVDLLQIVSLEPLPTPAQSEGPAG